jgi:hypothetical protein
MGGRGTAAVKGASPGGRLTRRDEPARCINDEDAGRNSNGHRPRSACTVNGPHPYSASSVSSRGRRGFLRPGFQSHLCSSRGLR